jgi:hypothetical protein
MCGFGSGPKIPDAPPPIPMPQASKAPDQDVFVQRNAAKNRQAMAGNASTLLTGPEGDVVDSGQLGKASLLGG